MKLPSLFKTPLHSRFGYEPRYYDPIKEEVDLKIAAAKKALLSANKGGDEAMDYKSSISEAFQRRQKASGRASVYQLLIAVALLGTFVGWLFYGNDVFYIYLLVSPVYFYFRIKKKT